MGSQAPSLPMRKLYSFYIDCQRFVNVRDPHWLKSIACLPHRGAGKAIVLTRRGNLSDGMRVCLRCVKLELIQSSANRLLCTV